MKTRVVALERRNDRLVVAIILASLALALVVAGSARTFGTFTGATNNPGNSFATSTSLWFDATGTATAIYTGLNVSLTCPFGSRGHPVTVTATFTLKNKNAASNAFTLAVVDGTGPAGISTIVTAKFAGNNKTNETLAAGATDTVNVTLTTKAGTTTGAYTGTILITDTTTGRSFSVPLSVTVV